MRMLAVTWANDTCGKSAFWLHADIRRGIRPSVDDQLGITPRASPDSSGYIFAPQRRVSAAHTPFQATRRRNLGLEVPEHLAQDVGSPFRGLALDAEPLHDLA